MPLHWHTEPLLLGALLGVFWLYFAAVWPWRQNLAPGAPFPPARAAAFAAGLLTVYAAVGSPLDAVGERFLLTAHMVQHLLLTFVAPPLLVLGLPGWLAEWLARPPAVRAVAAALVHPVTAGVAFTLVTSLWHLPPLYEAALRDKPTHILEHAMFFGSGLLLWWPVLSPSAVLPPAGYGTRMLLLFLVFVGQMPVYGYLTLTDVVLYPTYEFAPRLAAFPLTPLEDQILAGILMMAANIAALLSGFGGCFYAWARPHARPLSRPPANGPAASPTTPPAGSPAG